MLKLEKIYFSFGTKTILSNIDISFDESKIYGILGLNGAGKTTLFRLLFGIYHTHGGSITLNGEVIRRSDIAFLETENYFYPYTKGMEYLQLVTTLQVHSEAIEQWNKLFELPLDDLIETYSTGMRKKLAFLGVLLQNRKVIILDEPFNGIDLESSERLFFILDALRQKGKIILLSSHILASLTSICDKIIQLSEGKVVAQYDKNDFSMLTQQLQDKVRATIEKQLSNLIS